MSFELGDPTFDARTGIAGATPRGRGARKGARRASRGLRGTDTGFSLIGDPTFDPRTGIAGSAVASSGRGGRSTGGRGPGRSGGGLGELDYALVDRPVGVRRAPPRGWAGIDRGSLGDPTFDPRTGIAGDYPGLGFSLKIKKARFKVNAKSITRPLKSAVKYAPVAAVALPVASFVPGVSSLVSKVPLVNRYTNLFHRGQKIQQQVKAAGLNVKVQEKPDGGVQVVAVDSAGAVVSKPLPIPPTAVPDSQVLPVNAVQAAPTPAAAAAAVTTPPTDSTITSILDFMSKKVPPSPTSAAATDSGGGGGGSSGGGGGAPPSNAPIPDGATPTAPAGMNPLYLAGGALALILVMGMHR